MAPTFNYGVGSYWEGDSGSVGLYAYGSEIHHGTMAEANDFLEYVRSQKKTKAEQDKYKIFMLVEVPQ
jgi:hypothetical protein